MLSQEVRPIEVDELTNIEQIKQQIKAKEFELYFIPDWDDNTQLHLLTEIHILRKSLVIYEAMD